MAGGIAGAVVIVVGGAVALRPWQRPPKPHDIRTDTPAEAAKYALDQPTFAAALAYTRPKVADYEYGVGQAMLTGWAAIHLRWADIEVDASETSFPLVKKDPDAERGKRLCADVTVLDIAASGAGLGKRYTGLMISRSFPTVPYAFTAVRSTGAIVEHSAARFCGYVLALHRYQSNDGPREGLQVLGMFDLPENRTP
jgi:hypothetical protein